MRPASIPLARDAEWVKGDTYAAFTAGLVDLTPRLHTHRFPLDQSADAYGLFGERRDGALKAAITP